MGEKIETWKQLLVEAITDVMTDDPSCECERCQSRRDWAGRAKKELEKSD